MKRSYWSGPVRGFLSADPHTILGALSAVHPFDITDLQRNAWMYQISFLKKELSRLSEAYVLLEYSIPRMGERVDAVIIVGGLVFLLEFKVGAVAYHRHDICQVLDYALDLKYFHAESQTTPLVPVLIATAAPDVMNVRTVYPDKVWEPLRLNPTTFAPAMTGILSSDQGPSINPLAWESAKYSPTPSIIEAAQVLYDGHNVADIARSEAANITTTTDAVSLIIERAKAESRKAICFITGVPGSGKTLAGLNLATQRRGADIAEHAVFLSGNGPLVRVLQEALARSDVASGGSASKGEALAKTKAFIQMIHYFRDEAFVSNAPPLEKVVVFDEAQRAWTREQLKRFMAQKKGIPDFAESEPEFLLGVMNRHPDWAVLVCLIGGGQEINTGEAGLPEWFRAIGAQFPHWDVYVSDKLTEYEYDQGTHLYSLVNPGQLTVQPNLHLATSIRSFRSENVSTLVKAILDVDISRARTLYSKLHAKYPIYLTRSLPEARNWVRSVARGTERFGLTASSGAHRLRPVGINVETRADPANWFLNDATDVRSSYYLEEVATEFDVQGLELDWTIVVWDADLRIIDGEWQFMAFRGTQWGKVLDPVRRMYLRNAYRVLLTRARQGMVIVVPTGEPLDPTRLSSFYDGTYEYLKELGLRVLGEDE